MLFSKRYGYEPQKPLQFENMDDDLRMAIHNVLVDIERLIKYRYYDKYYDEDYQEYHNDFLLNIWCNFYVQDANDYYNYDYNYIKKKCDEKYKTLPWYKVYDFLEFYLGIIEHVKLEDPNYNSNIVFTGKLNAVFKKYNSAYRFVDNKIVPITNQHEIAEIEEAANTGIKSIDHHLNRAIEIFSHKKHKDYVNTIKEAILAVEATVNFINGTEGKTLSDGLDILKEKKSIHPALCDAFKKIYGYTSDKKSGIRHCIFDGTDCIPDFTDAKYMLVAYSAFINYLLSKAKE